MTNLGRQCILYNQCVQRHAGPHAHAHNQHRNQDISVARLKAKAEQEPCTSNTDGHAGNSQPLVPTQARDQLPGENTPEHRCEREWCHDEATIGDRGSNHSLDKQRDEEDAAEETHAKDDCHNG